MIVTCEECSTSFQLDESRIPESGARVRCSRCKHAFFLPNPSASQTEAVDSIAEDAAGDSLAGVPEAAPDLGSSGSSESLGGDPDLGVGGESPDASELDEEDWQFSEEIRIEGDEDLDEELDEGRTDDLGDAPDVEEDADSSDVFGTELEIDAAADEEPTEDIESDHSIDLANPPAAAAEPRDESDFGSVDDFSSLMEEDDIEQTDLDSDVESELQIEKAPAQTTSVYSSSGMSDDLGDPESWDLVGSDDFSKSGPASGMTRRPVAQSSASTEAFFDDDSDAIAYDDEAAPVSKLRDTLSNLGRRVGWAATITMVGAVLFLGLRGEWTRGAQMAQVVSAGGLTAQTTNASWIETSRSGYVLIVEGQLRNDGAESLWPGTLQLALLDVNGGRLTEEPIRAGEPMAAVVLREGSPDEVVATARAAALRFGQTPMASGETRLFEAVVLEDHLPEGASRVLLEMSGPGIVTNLPASIQMAATPGVLDQAAVVALTPESVEREQELVRANQEPVQANQELIQPNQEPVQPNQEPVQLNQESDFSP